MEHINDARFVLERRPGWNPKPTTAKEFAVADEEFLEVIQAPVRGFRLRRPRNLEREFAGKPEKLKAAKKTLARVDFRENDDIEAPVGTKAKKVRRLMRGTPDADNAVLDAAVAAASKRRHRKKASR